MAASVNPGKRPQKKSAVGSRNPTARPRKVAGRAVPQESGPAEAPTADTPPVAPVEPVEPVDAPPDVAAHDDPPVEWPVEGAEPRSYGGRRATAALVAGIVVLAGVGGAEAWYLWGQGDPVVSSSRPVVTSQLTASSVADTASQAVVDIISSSFETYDEQVEEASSRMTSTFAEEYLETKADIREEFVEQRTEVTAEVSARGVVSASPEQVVALVFLTQTTTKDGADLTVAQYKVRVTMRRTESGWLVEGIATQ